VGVGTHAILYGNNEVGSMALLDNLVHWGMEGMVSVYRLALRRRVVCWLCSIPRPTLGMLWARAASVYRMKRSEVAIDITTQKHPWYNRISRRFGIRR
jgi:hypothetical protein